jgi:hypothetical protein
MLRLYQLVMIYYMRQTVRAYFNAGRRPAAIGNGKYEKPRRTRPSSTAGKGGLAPLWAEARPKYYGCPITSPRRIFWLYQHRDRPMLKEIVDTLIADGAGALHELDAPHVRGQKAVSA